jgi:hypothetical protein
MFHIIDTRSGHYLMTGLMDLESAFKVLSKVLSSLPPFMQDFFAIHQTPYIIH